MAAHDGNAEMQDGAPLRRRDMVRLLSTVPLMALAACAYGPGYGPPPHAPAWGRRRKLAWDPVLGVYAVVGLPGIYYVEPHYYRFADGVWLVSDDLDRWHSAPGHALPPGLAKQHGKGHRKHGKGHRK